MERPISCPFSRYRPLWQAIELAHLPHKRARNPGNIDTSTGQSRTEGYISRTRPTQNGSDTVRTSLPMPQHLTDATIRRLPVPPRGNKITYDDVPGFGVRVTASGARSFVLNYLTKGGRERRITIGSCGDWSTSDARREARRLRQLVDQGGDPLADIEAAREAPTIADLLQRYEQEYLPRLRESSRSDYLRMIRDYIRPHFGPHTKVADVTFADVDALHRKVTPKGGLNRKTGKPHGGPYRANRARRLAVEIVLACGALEHAQQQSVQRRREKRRA